MWNFKSCSKITQDRIRQKSYELHREKLLRMKSKLKIKQPEQPEFIYTKNKLEMSRRDSLYQIQKQNRHLLSKINIIQERDNPTLQKQNYGTGSLHRTIFTVVNNKIFNQNKRICEKLLHISPFYKTDQILTKAEQLQYVAHNISQNARRAQSAISRSKSLYIRPQSGYTSRPRSGLISASHQKVKKTSSTSLFPSKINSQNRAQSAPAFRRAKVYLNEYKSRDYLNNEQDNKYKQTGKIVVDDNGQRLISQN